MVGIIIYSKGSCIELTYYLFSGVLRDAYKCVYVCNSTNYMWLVMKSILHTCILYIYTCFNKNRIYNVIFFTVSLMYIKAWDNKESLVQKFCRLNFCYQGIFLEFLIFLTTGKVDKEIIICLYASVLKLYWLIEL